MKYRKVPVEDLLVDDRYQRALDESRVKQMASHFDERLLGTLEVSQRNGKAAVFDGQHRLAVLKMLGRESAPCLVHDDLSPTEEAELFIAHQQQRKGVSQLDRFHARLFFGETVAHDIKAVVETVGCHIARHRNDHRQDNAIQAVASLERAYRRYGGVALGDALSHINDLWAGDRGGLHGSIIEGFTRFIAEYGDRLTPERLERLRQVAPLTILRRAAGRRGVATGGAMGGNEVNFELRKITGVRGRPRPQKKSAA